MQLSKWWLLYKQCDYVDIIALWLYEGLLLPDHAVLGLGRWWGQAYVMGEAVWDQTWIQSCFSNKEKMNPSVPGWQREPKSDVMKNLQ